MLSKEINGVFKNTIWWASLIIVSFTNIATNDKQVKYVEICLDHEQKK